MKKILNLVLPLLLILSHGCYYEDIPREAAVNPSLCVGSTIAATATTTDTSGCGISDGSITVNATGGIPPYQYALGNGAKQSSNIFSAVLGGTYSITVYDSKPCSFILNGIVVNNAGSTLAATATPSANTGCLTPNGQVILSATGGTSPYKYSFNGSTLSTTSTYTGLASGTYSAKVVDNNGAGCEVAISVTVPREPTGVTYSGTISTIITTKCASAQCHGAGNKKPGGDLTTWDLVNANAAEIKTRTGNQSMPKVGSLTSDQIKQIACWVDDGALNN